MFKQSSMVIFPALLLLNGCAFDLSKISFAPQTSRSDTDLNSGSSPLTNTRVISHKLYDLKYKVAEHTTPDALVHIAPGFDSSKPIELIVYNHGMMTDLNMVEETWNLEDVVRTAAPNTVLVAPEWAVVPSALSDKAGQMHSPGFFRSMLLEIFSRVPELKDKTLADVNTISLSSFSGGLYPLVSQLEKNGIEEKVVNITLYDSLYRGRYLDRWLEKNIKELAAGKKRYYNFYFDTYPQSLAQLDRLKNMLASANLSNSSLYTDLTDGNSVMPLHKIVEKPIVFKYAVNYDDQWTGHNAVPHVYLSPMVKAYSMTGVNPRAIAVRLREAPPPL